MAAKGTKQLEMVSCGNCKRCTVGKVHGPYWYSYRSVSADNERHQKTVSTYIGKYDWSNDRNDASAERQEQALRMQEMSVKCADLLLELLDDEEDAVSEEIVSADKSARAEMRLAKKADTKGKPAEREKHREQAQKIRKEAADKREWMAERLRDDGRIQPATHAGLKSVLPKFRRRVKTLKEAKKSSPSGATTR
jgi:hypothetical protein